MAANGKKFDFSKFAHLDTDPDLEKAGVPTPVGNSDIVLTVARAGGRNYGFDAHRQAVVERWQKTHGRGSLKGDDLRNFTRDIYVHCIKGWNEDIVGVPYDTEAARELIDLETVFNTTFNRANEVDGYLRAKVEDAKDAAGND